MVSHLVLCWKTLGPLWPCRAANASEPNGTSPLEVRLKYLTKFEQYTAQGRTNPSLPVGGVISGHSLQLTAQDSQGDGYWRDVGYRAHPLPARMPITLIW